MMTITQSRLQSPLLWIQPLAFALCFTLTVPRDAHGQWSDAVAVSAPRETRVRTRASLALGAVPDDTWQTRSFWRWTALGFLAGAVAADGWAAVQMASNKSGDGGMISPVIPLVIVGAAGGLGGGLIGAVAYIASHPAPDPSPR